MKQLQERVELPASQELDMNREKTVWSNGRMVALDEGSHISIYFGHEEERRTVYDEEGRGSDVTVVTAISKRFRKSAGAEELLGLAGDSVNAFAAAVAAVNLPLARDVMTLAVQRHDASDAVNRFMMGGVPMWLDKATRTGLRMRLDAEANAGKTETTLWYGRYSVTLPVQQAMEMLMELELYASKCYDVTQEHLAAVAAMESPEQLMAYDQTAGYPQLLEF